MRKYRKMLSSKRPPWGALFTGKRTWAAISGQMFLATVLGCSLFQPDSQSGPPLLAGVALAAPIVTSGSPTGGSAPTTSASQSQFIRAVTGGTVTLGEELVLTIPPNSMDRDRVITVERLGEVPSGYADGYQYYGQAYRMLPDGTTFDPGNPARLELIYNSAQLAAQGRNPATLSLFSFDPGLGRYVASASYVSATTGKLVAALEHFTDYMPAALPSLPMNTAPTTPTLGALPAGGLRAGAPVLLRTRAFDSNGVAGVQLFYRTYNGAPPFPFAADPGLQSVWMQQHPAYPGVPATDVWYYVVPASATTAAPGWAIEYCMVAYDNLGTPSAAGGSPGACVPVTQSFVRRLNTGFGLQVVTAPGSFTAGQRFYVTLLGRDTLGTNFPIYTDEQSSLPTVVPSWSSDPAGAVPLPLALGSFSFGGPGNTNNVLFEARGILNPLSPDGPATTLTGYVGVQIGATPIATTAISVSAGPVTGLEILDPLDAVVNATVQAATEGSSVQFDVRGVDGPGNRIAILPQQLLGQGGWTVSPDSSAGPAATAPGTITNIVGCPPGCPPLAPESSGFWDTLDVVGHVRVLISFAGKTASAIYNVAARALTAPEGPYISGAPYHFANESWSPSLVFVGPVLHLTYTHQNNWASPYTSTSSGYGYEIRDHYLPAGGGRPDAGTSDGIANALNHQVGSGQTFLATDGTNAYVTYTDTAWNADLEQVRLKKLNYAGGQWANVPAGAGPSSLNLNTGRPATNPTMAFVGSDLWITWTENNGTGNFQVVVKCYCSGAWQLKATSLNRLPTNNAQHARIVDAGGLPMVIWRELDGTSWQLYAKVFNGAWSSETSLNVSGVLNAGTVDAAGSGSGLTITWRETDATTQNAYVRRYSGGPAGTWSAPFGAGPLNSDTSFGAFGIEGSPEIALDAAGRPYVLITEGFGSTRTTTLRHYNPALASWRTDAQVNSPGKFIYRADLAIYGSAVHVAFGEYPSGQNSAMAYRVYK